MRRRDETRKPDQATFESPAFGMAAAGFDYRQILSHYYAGVEIERRALGGP